MSCASAENSGRVGQRGQALDIDGVGGQKNFFSGSELAMLIAHLGVAAPVTASDARLHGGPAGVCVSGSTRASHTSARAPPPPPKAPPTASSPSWSFYLMRTELLPKMAGAPIAAPTSGVDFINT